MKKYKGYRLSKKEAQLYGREMDRLVKRNNGNITPKDVLECAKDKKCPLHDYFEWDNTIAGEMWRLQQASYLIRTLDLVIEGDSGPTEIRAFFNVSIPEGDGETTKTVYVSNETAFSNANMRKQVIDYAYSELVGWRNRYKQYSEFGDLFRAIDGFKKNRR